MAREFHTCPRMQPVQGDVWIEMCDSLESGNTGRGVPNISKM